MHKEFKSLATYSMEILLPLKNKLINVYMAKERNDVGMKKFTKKVLMERLDFTEDEAKVIMEAQRMFPELLVDDEKMYIESLRNLYSQLGIDKSNWSRWTKKNVKENEFFLENKDWWGFVIMTNGNKTEDFKVTIEFAKNLAMTVKNENGHMIRRYFILMEKAVKKMSDWLLIRNPQKQGYKDMSKAVKYNYMQLHNGEEPNQFIYIHNADMVNLALLGHKSKSMKELLEVQYDDALRDHVTLEVNKALYELQQLNENLLYSNVDFKTRKMIIETTVRTKYAGLRIRFTSEFAKELSLIRD